MRIAVIGQSAFSAEFLKQLLAKKFCVCGVFTPPNDQKSGKEDILATTAKQLGLPLFKVAKWRVAPETRKALPDVLEQYKSCQADLNVLPYCNQFIPMDIIEAPKYKSINYHPSLLPRHRGAASINWTLIMGDKEAGLTIFWTDDGLDTGPILMKRSCWVRPDDTIDSLYSRFLFPVGVEALVESVEMIRDGVAPRVDQPELGASYEPPLRGKQQEAKTKIDMSKLDTGVKLHNFIRGMDKVPGAWISMRVGSISPEADFERVKLFGSSIWSIEDYGEPVSIRPVEIEGYSGKAFIHKGGFLIYPPQGDQTVNVTKLQNVETGKMLLASQYGSAEANRPSLELTSDECRMEESIRQTWAAILASDSVSKSTDFFNAGAGSMDVVRLAEEVKELVGDVTGFELEPEDVYMASRFDDFIDLVMRRCRGESSSSSADITYEFSKLEANRMQIKVPTQLFIGGKFVSASAQMDVINPTTEDVICQVQMANANEVSQAVQAAYEAFHGPENVWRKMNARDRGRLLYKLADLMEQHKEELATLESIDSGAVYTLALKTHIGMSIDVFRYFAGLCDKIEGKTIPINNARPNNNLAFSEREPIGVCGIITPWNYPLMMVAWKSAACLAAGNTLVLKPAQTCPLTTLKWAELVAKAGFPAGVVNVVTGKGSVCGQAILDHPLVDKVAFTGSTETGKHILKSCASVNIKRCSLELGGNSPLIIFADCDFKKAVKFGMSSVFFNKGENCIAAGRLFVEDSIHDRFIEAVVEELKKMVIDDPLKRSTAHGPQNHLEHLQSLLKFIDHGLKDGAKLVYGGHRLNRKGYFLVPTVLTEVEDGNFVAKEESFGPIMIVSRFANEDVDGVIRRANRTRYGLASGVISNDFSKAMKVARSFRAGTCFINCYNKTDVASPFGGFKDSGFGKDLGQEALNDYLVTRMIIAEY